MSCSVTSDKCDKYVDYFILIYLSSLYYLSSLALVASSVWCTSNYERTRVLPSAFQCAVYFISFYTLYFLGMPIVTQQTVTYITINDLNKVAPITTVERRRQLRLFRAWQKFQQQQSPRQRYCSCALSATAMLRYAIGRRVLETFNADCIGFTLMSYSLNCDLFVIFVFYMQNITCDFGLFLCDFGCFRSN